MKNSQMRTSQRLCDLGPSLAWTLFLIPLVAVFMFAAFLLLPHTSKATLSLLMVDGPIDLITALVLIAVGLQGLRLVWRLRKDNNSGRLTILFYLVFSLAFIFMSLAEVPWGRSFFEFKPSQNVSSNVDHVEESPKPPLKSLYFLRNHMEIIPLMFGLAIVLVYLFSRKVRLQEISPPYILLPWFLIIGVVATIDLSHDFFVPWPRFNDLINNMEEGMELLLGISGVLLIWLNGRVLLAPGRLGQRATSARTGNNLID